MSMEYCFIVSHNSFLEWQLYIYINVFYVYDTFYGIHW